MEMRPAAGYLAGDIGGSRLKFFDAFKFKFAVGVTGLTRMMR
jgi:hypothetical protein